MELFSALCQPQPKDKYWTPLTINQALHRNGVIIEQARNRPMLERGLKYIETKIIDATRQLARNNEISEHMIRYEEMEGERDKAAVYKPIRVKSKFSYWISASYGFPAMAFYIVTESNHPAFPFGGTFDAADFEKSGITIPKTPSFEKWDKMGRPIYRGE